MAKSAFAKMVRGSVLKYTSQKTFSFLTSSDAPLRVLENVLLVFIIFSKVLNVNLVYDWIFFPRLKDWSYSQLNMILVLIPGQGHQYMLDLRDRHP